MDQVEGIITAAKNGDFDRVADLLYQDPVLAKASNMFGAQPVHAAHFGGHRRVVELLLSHGLSMDLFLAAELGLLDRVEVAVRAEPQIVHAFGTRGSQALHGACYWGQVAVAEFLLRHGADPNAATRDGFLGIRPLGCAVATPNVPNPSDSEAVVLELVRLLLDRGAEVNGRRRDGLTALHGAAYRGHKKVIACLLEHGADSLIRGYEGAGAHAGQTAFDVAVAQGQREAATLLDATDGCGNSSA
jgi:ankyrin repeat protein